MSRGNSNGSSSAAVPSARRMKWFGTTSLVRSNHHADIWVSTFPFSGMPVGKIASNAEMRSVATISSRSPRSYVSRTFPRYVRFGSGDSISNDICLLLSSFQVVEEQRLCRRRKGERECERGDRDHTAKERGGQQRDEALERGVDRTGELWLRRVRDPIDGEDERRGGGECHECGGNGENRRHRLTCRRIVELALHDHLQHRERHRGYGNEKKRHEIARVHAIGVSDNLAEVVRRAQARRLHANPKRRKLSST